MKVELREPGAQAPSKMSAGAAGFDLYASERVMLYHGSRRLVPTGVAIAIEPGWYGRIAPRSSLAHKHGIDVLAGVIDADYRGNIGVILLNTGIEDVEIGKGARIAQLIIERCWDGQLEVAGELPETGRGDGGFGSTGR